MPTSQAPVDTKVPLLYFLNLVFFISLGVYNTRHHFIQGLKSTKENEYCRWTSCFCCCCCRCCCCCAGIIIASPFLFLVQRFQTITHHISHSRILLHSFPLSEIHSSYIMIHSLVIKRPHTTNVFIPKQVNCIKENIRCNHGLAIIVCFTSPVK